MNSKAVDYNEGTSSVELEITLVTGEHLVHQLPELLSFMFVTSLHYIVHSVEDDHEGFEIDDIKVWFDDL